MNPGAVLLFMLGALSTARAQAPEAAPNENEEALAEELKTLLGAPPPPAPTGPGQSAAATNFIGVSANAVFAGGGSTAGPDALAELQGGAHDPNQRGVTVQNLELSLLGAVDPYFSGEVHILFQLTPEGESAFELEEAFLVSQALPWGLQLKAGTYFTEFGRLNPQHPHVWDFVDQPVVSSRLMGGDGLRNPGARLSWLTPLPWWAEVFIGVQNSHGETAHSFLGSDEEAALDGIAHSGRRIKTAGDMLYSARLLQGFSPSDTTAINLGISAATGANNSGPDARSTLGGVDLYAKWQPLNAYRGYPFVSLQGEWMFRSYDLPDDQRRDWGSYLQAVWGFHHRWTWGVRYDCANGNGFAAENLPQRRRVSSNMSFVASEYSRFRLQYNYDHTDALMRGHAHSVWLQASFIIGSHGAHTF